ncbi:hypothetical protein QEZ52_00285 [Aliisedimentitalea scapharcae]|uniref:Uncharacterized protein n=1 Tax=Aliisedimentitalea scapharcae TaxID=1524259 RepID=A0ABZ2XSF5_9RHOB
MGDETDKQPKPKARATRKPARVDLVNQNRKNGVLGTTARVLEKDIDAWLAKGWQRANPAADAG